VSGLTLLAAADGWRIFDEVCHAGPKDRSFEEQHSRFSVSAVLSGTFVYRSTRGRTLMSPGSLLLGQQGANFCCSHEHGAGDRCVAFYFDDSWIEKFADEIRGVRPKRLTTHRIAPVRALTPLLAEISTLANGENPGGGEELAFRIAAAALCLGHSNRDFKDDTPRDQQRIAEALRIIESRLTEPLAISALASDVAMSRYHFLRTFQRVTGETPWRYIVNRRLALAAERLLTASGTVLDAVLASGFGDLSEFTRLFRLQFGVSPGFYRRRRATCFTSDRQPPRFS
jgi:AraC family transcriptional regulator